MKVLTLATLVAVSGLAAAQVDKIPDCAFSCFTTAIGKTDCGLNTYCQCTTGAKVIQSSVIQCLCNSGACSQQELLQLQDASNVACSSALAASSETYHAATLPANVCKAEATGTAGNSTGTAAAASSSSSMGSSSSQGPAVTNAPLVGYEACAAIAVGALALFGI